MQFLNMLLFNYSLNNCPNTHFRVIKDIRLHKAHFEPWILNSDIKVCYYFIVFILSNLSIFQIIHLIRDPRAIYASMSRSKLRRKPWEGYLSEFGSLVCENMLKDSHLSQIIPSER